MSPDHRDAMNGTDARAHTFIIRIREVSPGPEGSPAEWRGEVLHVPGGRSVPFRRLESIPALLERLIREAGPA